MCSRQAPLHIKPEDLSTFDASRDSDRSAAGSYGVGAEQRAGPKMQWPPHQAPEYWGDGAPRSPSSARRQWYGQDTQEPQCHKYLQHARDTSRFKSVSGERQRQKNRGAQRSVEQRPKAVPLSSTWTWASQIDPDVSHLQPQEDSADVEIQDLISGAADCETILRFIVYTAQCLQAGLLLSTWTIILGCETDLVFSSVSHVVEPVLGGIAYVLAEVSLIGSLLELWVTWDSLSRQRAQAVAISLDATLSSFGSTTSTSPPLGRPAIRRLTIAGAHVLFCACVLATHLVACSSDMALLHTWRQWDAKEARNLLSARVGFGFASLLFAIPKGMPALGRALEAQSFGPQGLPNYAPSSAGSQKSVY